MPYNFVADSFTQINFVVDFLQAKCDFKWKTAVLRFQEGGEVRGNVHDHLRFIEKRVVDLLLVLIEVFLLGVTAEVLRTNID